MDVMIFFWSSLDFVENWISAKVMTFFVFGLHLILLKIGRNVSFFFSLFLANMSFFFIFSSILLSFFHKGW